MTLKELIAKVRVIEDEWHDSTCKTRQGDRFPEDICWRLDELKLELERMEVTRHET